MSDVETESRESTLTILKRLWGVLAPYTARVFGLALLVSFSAALEAAGPQFVRYAFDVVIPQGEGMLFLWFGLAFAGFYLFRAVVGYGAMYGSFAHATGRERRAHGGVRPPSGAPRLAVFRRAVRFAQLAGRQ